MEGREGKRNWGGRREEVSKRKCSGVEKTKAQFDHVPGTEPGPDPQDRVH